MAEERKHPNDMTRDELRELCGAMAWMALDLAQHLHFSVYMLKPEYTAKALARAVGMAYDLSNYPYAEQQFPGEAKADLAVFGPEGLTVVRSNELSNIFPIEEDGT